MESPNKGHVGTRGFVLYREVSFIRRLKCNGIIGIGTSRLILFFIERCSLFGVFFIGGSTVLIGIISKHAKEKFNSTKQANLKGFT